MIDAGIVTIVATTITVVGAIVAALIKFGSDYIIKKIEIKEKQKHEEHLKNNLAQLEQDITNHSKIDEICDSIQNYIKASKVNVWMFHNGGYYYTGSPIQRLSMVAGVAEGMADDVKQRFTNLPIGIFSRNLSKLLEVDYVHEKNELMYQDPLAIINLQYGIISSALFKLKSVNEQDWIGILAIGWEEHKQMSDDDVNFVKTKLDNITRLLTPKLLF